MKEKDMEKLMEEGENMKETGLMIKNFNEMESITGKSKTNVFTTITDSRQIFNLENECDYKINDCKGEIIRVKNVLIKVIERPLPEPEVNEETGEVIDKEYKKVCILIDDNNKLVDLYDGFLNDYCSRKKTKNSKYILGVFIDRCFIPIFDKETFDKIWNSVN